MIKEANKKSEAARRLTQTLVALGLDSKQDIENNRKIDEWLTKQSFNKE
jgi:hypothetical protein